MIEKRTVLLTEPFKTKVKVFMRIVKRWYNNLAPFETIRTKERQEWLVKNGKSWTMNSYHLKWLAVDRVFLNQKRKPTRIGNYDYLHYVGKMCWMTGIYKNWKLIEECHLQDDWRTIEQVKEDNSKRYNSITNKEEQDLLHSVNVLFGRWD